ncbi:hypothetical protein [Ancylomarina longa]|uniref:Uncharacterized protein n=1 Tax=Ancylomarina longa TaxID=2487017 RepID=A0A434AZK5_9BACT|nr:hypothetical protein [Ancylomarina longa]RUT80051.1 hypothetical protein DLK05_01455 [Ancylomarina longa]
MKHSSLLFFGIFLFTISLYAQTPKTFSHDSLKFQEELLQFMDHPTKKKESKSFAQQFPEFWFSASISPEERQKIYKICDLFLSKKARSFPDFYNYFRTLFLFQKQNLPQTDFENWEKGLLQQMGNKKNKLSSITDFLVQTQHLFRDSILNASYSNRWSIKNADFSYQFENKLSIVFNNADLSCISQRDTSRIYKTSGTYYPFEKLWIGKKGKITWERAGKDPATEYATFNSYHINIKQSSYKIDTVQYLNKDLFPGVILGSLSEKINPVRNPRKAIYPKFESFDKAIQIDSLFKHVNYKGGIAINGAKFIGKGSSDSPAEIHISRNDTLFLIAKSQYFAFQPERIVGQNTQIKILIDTCLIYHPGLLFKYFPQREELNLIRDGEGISASPYFDNYHNIIMDFGMLIWKLGENMMHFGSMKGATKRQARFESMNFFSMRRYMRIQGMDQQNPLVLLRKFADYMYVDTFTASEYANYIKKPINQIRQQLLSLSFQGFVSYNTNTDEVTLQKRLTDYIQSGMGRQDYDVIRFTTQTKDKESDAIYFIGSSNLQINGVRRIAVSDSQNVVIYPKYRKILLKKNLDFQFDGKITAGLLDMYGKDFSFSYQNFKIDLNRIDSLQINFVIDSLSNYGKRYTTQLGSVLEKITGDLLIDDPNNKSGHQKFPEYPIFNSTDSSYVFYDDRSIQNGVYKADKFYFKVDPYTIKNINKFDKEDIELSGTFVSDSIFPIFDEVLKIQKDNSLGFAHLTPQNGFPTYRKGVFTDTIHLSNQGLRGNGTLNYLSSVTQSKDFIFRPNDMRTNAQSFVLKEQETLMNNPEVNGEHIYIEWFPYHDEMYVKSSALPLDMYRKLATLAGTLKITPEGITGEGNMELVNAELNSKYFTYNKKNILADSANFKLKNTEAEGYTFESESVNTNIDFVSRSGKFESTTPKNLSIFPADQYLARIQNFKWYMDQQSIDFGNRDESILAQLWEQNQIESLDSSSLNQFISIDPKQDSLAFATPIGHFNALDQTIQAKFVKRMNIADAEIYPDKGDLSIEKGGSLQTLRNAKLIADTIHHYHTITDATLNVHGKNSYSGSGNYTYIDNSKTEQNILFDVIDVDSLGQTIALGDLPEERSFSLSPDFDYKGKIRLEARDSALYFDGQTRIHNKCDKIKDNWLDFAAKINPMDILIPVKTYATDDDRLKLYNSFFLTNDSIHIYSSFLSHRIFYTDNVLLDAEGFLTYNKNLQAYQIASREKLKDENAFGNILSFYQNNCNMKGEGAISLGAELGQMKQVAAGNIDHDLSSDIVTLDLIYGLDFFFSDACTKIMENAFQQANLRHSKLNKQVYTRKLTALMGREKAVQAMSEMDANGIFKNLPKELQHSIYFNNLDFIWDKESKAYQSIGEIGIGSINDIQINKSVKGKVELDKKRSGNRITIYLEIDKSTWFFFEYFHGVMFARSSDEEFNNILHEMKEDKRKFKDPLKKNPYSYILSPRSAKTKFLRRFNL